MDRLLRHHTDVAVEIDLDANLTDIVTERDDPGIRLGEQVSQG